MLSKHPRMRLSRDEEVFLRHWMYDETHYMEGQGPAKRLQVQHRAVPADLAALIAASMPDPVDQGAAGIGPPPTQPPAWPWPGDALQMRLKEAQAALARAGSAPKPQGEPNPALQRTPAAAVRSPAIQALLGGRVR